MVSKNDLEQSLKDLKERERKLIEFLQSLPESQRDTIPANGSLSYRDLLKTIQRAIESGEDTLRLLGTTGEELDKQIAITKKQKEETKRELEAIRKEREEQRRTEARYRWERMGYNSLTLPN